MTARTIEPVNRTSGTGLAKAFGPVPAGEEWSVAVRVCASGSADGIIERATPRTIWIGVRLGS